MILTKHQSHNIIITYHAIQLVMRPIGIDKEGIRAYRGHGGINQMLSNWEVDAKWAHCSLAYLAYPILVRPLPVPPSSSQLQTP